MTNVILTLEQAQSLLDLIGETADRTEKHFQGMEMIESAINHGIRRDEPVHPNENIGSLD